MSVKDLGFTSTVLVQSGCSAQVAGQPLRVTMLYAAGGWNKCAEIINRVYIHSLGLYIG